MPQAVHPDCYFSPKTDIAVRGHTVHWDCRRTLRHGEAIFFLNKKYFARQMLKKKKSLHCSLPEAIKCYYGES